MVGDQGDIVARIRAVLPTRWFADESSVLDAVLSGFGSAWANFHALLSYARSQTRIRTASDVWLDIISSDFFGRRLKRRRAEPDDRFRCRILREISRERGTRAALVSSLTDLTGRAPLVFEPRHTGDTGGWGSLGAAVSGLSYGRVGGWGNLDLPFQCFVTAFRTRGSGIASVSGWSSPAGGYGRGSLIYGSPSMIDGQVTDADVLAAVARVLPVACIGWTRISN